MTHASLKYAQLLTQGEIFQGDLFMPTKYQRDRPKNDHDCVQHSGRKCVGFVDENQSPTRQRDFGEAQLTGDLPDNEFQFHATAIYASGGMLLSGDDLTKISEPRLAMKPSATSIRRIRE